MAFPPRFLDDLRERILLSDLIGKKIKLTSKGREFSGLCPFHHEKTPSFTVNDDKGFYHCFGCGAHGDIIKFAMDSEKMPFMEAIEYLAHLAGVPMPKSSPEQMERDKKQAGLTDIMETACQFFQEHLFGLSGKQARDYLMKRGMSGHVAKQFRLGYAPSGSALTARLQAKGYHLADCIALGLVVKNKATGNVHDYFYDRVMFPILDRRKRVIGFGGRIMGKGEPKYLNSPEMELFHKGEQLYALPNAIESIRSKNEAILVEGYMDVIALHSAGFTNAVAPLGTALTEKQIALLWQFCDEPVICFDGDNAGRRAASRAVSRALPILIPGKSLRFIWLPDGLDPDDMVRKRSPEAFGKVIQGAKPLTFALWNMLLEGRSLDTPERLAKLKTDALETIAGIKNDTVRSFYTKEIENRLWRLGRNQKQKKSLPFLSSLSVVEPVPGSSEAKMLMAYLICYPKIAQRLLEDISNLIFMESALDEALREIVELILESPDMDASALEQKTTLETIGLLKAEIEMLKKSKRSDKQVSDELHAWLQNARIKAIENDLTSKMVEYGQNPSSELWTKIITLKKEIEKLQEIE